MILQNVDIRNSDNKTSKEKYMKQIKPRFHSDRSTSFKPSQVRRR